VKTKEMIREIHFFMDSSSKTMYALQVIAR